MPQPPEDPFLWDTDRVCQELCCDGAEWTNDASALESLLRQNFMDGETLLTYELTFSRKDLLECLGIAAARHRSKLFRKILQLQKQSPRFREEKKSIETDDINQVFSHNQVSATPMLPPSQSPVDKTSPPSMQPPSEIAKRVWPLEEVSQKRRRIAPIFVTDISASSATEPMPGFDEPELSKPRMIYVADASSFAEESSTAYLGEKAVADLVPLEPDYSSDSGSDTFSSVNPPQPRGRTRAIYSRLKKYLLKNNRKIIAIQSGVKVSTFSDSDRDVINLDDLASLDEDTIREMENEEAENRQNNSSLLSSEKIEKIINEEILKFQAQWQERKLPKLERKAYHLWGQAKKESLLRRKAFEAQQEAGHLRHRLSTLTRDLRGLPWKTSEELRFQTCIVEQTVVDKLRQEWLANLFSLRSEPPKLSHPHTQAPRRRRARRIIHEDEISSSSEEESNVGSFIVEDNLALVRAISPGPQQNTPSPSTSYHLPLAHSDNYSVPHSPVSPIMAEANHLQTVIDLTMASDVEMDDATETLHHRFEEFTQDTPAQIGEKHPKHWAGKGDRFRLVISMLWRLDLERREAFFNWLTDNGAPDIWLELINTAKSRIQSPSPFKKDAVFDWMLVYLSFRKCEYQKEQQILKLKLKHINQMESSETSFPLLCGFLRSIQDVFPKGDQIAHLDELDVEGFIEIDGFPDQVPSRSDGRKKKNKRKAIVLDRGGVELRKRAERDMREQERRRDELRASIQKSNRVDALSARAPRFIINESKTDDQDFIYINSHISRHIKDHQIEGVRFLWNHIVRHESERQGCLLAHTMGLGKTMQTITFLVALRESALSDQLRNQIPEDLRDWKVLVLCPSGLVENWKDEFAIWAPEELMGNIVTIEAAQSPAQRIQNAKDWANQGGVLIIGYTMFKSGFRKGDGAPTNLDQILVDNATVVIADEAHLLKDPKTKITQVASKIKTSTRIALTGSPLANNVEEYYAMINWVAPNFLGPLQEFRDMYATPIHQGLYHDSSRSEKRTAIKMLQVLKTTAAPKVHRATIKSCLKHELPPKQEFVISVPPTEMQRKLYDLYIQGNDAESNDSDIVNQANLFGVLNHLALICAHPAVYRKKAIELQVRSEKGRDVARFPMATMVDVLKITAGQSLERTELSFKVELLNKILDQSARLGDKVLVFSQSIPTLDYLEKLFAGQQRKFRRLDGNTKINKRQEMVKNFNTDSKQVYLISTNAGGVGLNIHGANRVIIFDFKWNPVSDQQAIGRAYRIGQQKPVFVYRFVVAGSFEEDLQNKAVFKTQLAARVVDQKNVVSWSKRLGKLIHKIKHVDATESRFDFKGKDVILDHLLDHADRRAITSVMSSDTFEEEDETETLTAEERKEADSMVERHNMRVAGPEKYSQTIQTERTGDNRRADSHIVSGKPNKDGFSERPDTSYKLTSHYNHLSQALGLALAPAPALAPAAVPAPTKRSLLSSAPMTIAGSNTYYGSGGPRMAGLQPHPVPDHGRSTCFNEASSAEAREQFQQKLATALSVLVARNQPISLNALAKTSAVTAEISMKLSKRKKGHMADTQHWSMLAGMLENERFLLEIAAGRLSGQFLGTADEGTIIKRLQDLEPICDENCLDLIRQGGKSKDPESLSNIMRSPSRWFDNKTNKTQALEDLEAIRRASAMRNGERRSDMRSDLRTGQGPNLPSWANNVRGQGRLADSLLDRR